MQSRYKLADVENLKSELELLPEVQPESREVSLKQAMKVLAPVLKEMRQRRGYTSEQLLEVLRERGINIARSSLKDYLRGGRRPQQSAGPSRAKAKAARPPGQSAATTESTTAPNPATAAATPPTASKPLSTAVLPPPSARGAVPAAGARAGT